MDRNFDRSGSTRVLGGVDGRGFGITSIGGFNILADFGACSAEMETGGGGGGKRIRVEPVAGTFSFGTNSESWAGRGPRESFLEWCSRSTTDKGRDLGNCFCFCFCLEGPGCGKFGVVTWESAKSERKFGTARRWVDGFA